VTEGQETRSQSTTEVPAEGTVLVLGLGNVLLQDDGAGVQAVWALQKDPPPGAIVVEVGTAILDVLPLLEGARRVLLIDAMQAGGTPGTVYQLSAGDVAARDTRTSMHDIDLLGALALLPNRPKLDITVLGIEPRTIGYGMELTEDVAAALPLVAAAAHRIVRDWTTP